MQTDVAAAAVMKTVTNATVCGISTLAGLVVVQELRTQEIPSADFINKNPVARHLQICMNPWFLGLQGEGSTSDAVEFSQGFGFRC